MESSAPPFQAQVIDISAAGATIELAGTLAAEPAALRVEFETFDSALPMLVVDWERTWYGTVLHARFEGLSDPQKTFLQSLLAQLSDEQAAQLARMLQGRLIR
jgi:hypothetical protein